MQSDHSLHSANEMLKKSDEISSVVTALAKAQEDQVLSEEDKEALERGLHFLQEVEEGYSWMDENAPSVNKQSRLRAQSLHAAVDSWGLEENRGQFLDDVGQMKRAIRHLLNENEEVIELSSITRFFNNILNSNLDRLDSMYSNSILGNDRDQWVHANS